MSNRNPYRGVALTASLGQARRIAEDLDFYLPEIAKKAAFAILDNRLRSTVLRGKLVGLDQAWLMLFTSTDITYICSPQDGVAEHRVRLLVGMGKPDSHYTLPWPDKKQKIAAKARQWPLAIRRHFLQ